MLRLIAFTAVIPVSILFFTSVAAAYQAGGAQHPEPTSFDAICDSAMRSLQKGQAQQAVELLSEAAKLKPNDRTVHCSLGRAFADSGQLTEAIEQFQKCVKLDPGDAQAHYSLGQAYLQFALSATAEILKSAGTSPYARRIFAENYIAKNDFAEAEGQYRLALEADPGALDLYLALADVYLKMGQPVRAEEQAQRALRRFPFSLAGHYELGRAALVKGSIPSALDEFRWIAQFNPLSLQVLTRLPGFVTAGLSGSNGCTSLEEFAVTHPQELALGFMEKLCGIVIRPETASSSARESESESGSRPLETAGAKGTTLNENESCWVGLCDACAHGSMVSSTGMAGLTPRLELGRCFYEMAQYQPAYQSFLQARRLDPNSLESTYWLQACSRKLAAKSFERLSELDPDSYLVHLLNAQTFEEQGNRALAIKEYEAAIARRPDDVSVRVRFAHLQWKWLEYDQAAEQLTEALRLEPSDLLANYLLGDIWVEKHEAEKGLPYLEKALAIRPGFLNAEASLGRALAQLGRYQEAARELEAVASADQDGAIHYQLQQVYLKLGRPGAAKAALAAAEKIRSEQQSREAAGPNFPRP